MMEGERRYTLPKSAITTRWVRCTDELRASLKDRRDKLAATIKDTKAEIEELDSALAFLNSILPPKSLTSGAPPTPGQWSAGFPDGCKDCGSRETPHVAHGRCRSCDSKWRARGKPDEVAS